MITHPALNISTMDRRTFLRAGAGAIVVAASSNSALSGLAELKRKSVFPSGFAWGAATAAYQIEGAVKEDGRGESIWDHYTHSGATEANGDVACDHYHRHQEDVQLMARLGLTAYRFSIAWPRIYPFGHGQIEQRGIDFYSKLVDELLAAGITPYATLFHWDMPQALWDKHRGWLSKDVAKYFADYSSTMFKALGDRVQNWITHNEPKNVHVHTGYRDGSSAPGFKGGIRAALQASHNMFVGHGLAVQAFRASGKKGQIGITEAAGFPHPRDPKNPDDVKAAKIALQYDVFWHVDAILKGRYPALADEPWVQALMPRYYEKDLPTIHQPVDFFGINYYRDNWFSYDESQPMHVRFNDPPDVKRTPYGNLITPAGTYDLLMAFHQHTAGKKLYVTENGYAGTDETEKVVDGTVVDADRISFINSYLYNAARAVRDGANLHGWFVWSLLDNFEWGTYKPRFGIVYMDYKPLKRIPKKSAYWYGEVARTNGAGLL